MKNLVNYINESQEERRIDEAYFPPITAFPVEWQPYITALYALLIWWGSVAIATGCDDITGGFTTIKEIIKGKFRDFKYKRQLKEIKKLLEDDPDYKKWQDKPDKQRKLKDLTPIITKYKDDKDVKDIIKSVWDESKYSK